MRWEVSERFNKLIESTGIQVKNIAVVGGSTDDPEVEYFLGHEINIEFLGIEQVSNHKFEYFDLNKKSINSKQYDLVICSQVLEHIFDVKQGIENLINITEKGGIVWINCPYSNHSHGSPEFYSSGYSPALIEKLAEMHGAEVMYSSQIGSKRQYFFTHTIRFWPNKLQYRFPLKPRVSRFYLRKFVLLFIASFLSSKVVSDVETATETIVVLRKPL